METSQEELDFIEFLKNMSNEDFEDITSEVEEEYFNEEV